MHSGHNQLKELTELLFSDDYDHDSMGWLRLLHHCLLAHKEVQQDVAQAATPTCNLLNTCTSLLVSPATSLYAAKIESVLLRLALSSEEIGLALIDNVLRNPVLYGDRGEGGQGCVVNGFCLYVDLFYVGQKLKSKTEPTLPIRFYVMLAKCLGCHMTCVKSLCDMCGGGGGGVGGFFLVGKKNV